MWYAFMYLIVLDIQNFSDYVTSGSVKIDSKTDRMFQMNVKNLSLKQKLNYIIQINCNKGDRNLSRKVLIFDSILNKLAN